MPDRHATLACNLDGNLLRAALPLFEAERVQGLEWSFDAVFQHPALPPWFEELLDAFGQADRLVGHGVFFSLFSGRWSAEQQRWLAELRRLSARFRFDHVTEHFGFMTGADFHQGAPLGVPLTPSTLAIGRDRLQRLQDACGVPVGLENLAFAYSLEEVRKHGDFLHALLEPVEGFLLLDLHNLYCQLHNFGVEAADLLALYPLDRVRELHLSGGSWAESTDQPNRRIRRDTHDDAVPDGVFDLLHVALDACPNVAYVTLEQVGWGLDTEAARSQFQRDFLTMDAAVRAKNEQEGGRAMRRFFSENNIAPNGPPLEDEVLHAQQRQLAAILETASDYRQAQAWLAASDLARSVWAVETWEPHLLETAIAIAQKWKEGMRPLGAEK